MRMKIKPSISENNSPNSENKSSNSASDSLSSESESEEVCEVERIMGKQIVYGEVRIFSHCFFCFLIYLI